jgi:hypothetical protein
MNWFTRLFKSLRPKRSCWHRRLVDGLAAQCPVCRSEAEALANQAKDHLGPEIDAFTDALAATLPVGAEGAVCEITFEIVGGKTRFGFSFKEPKGFSPPGDVLFGPLMSFFTGALNKGHAVTKVEFIAKRTSDRTWLISPEAFVMAFGNR